MNPIQPDSGAAARWYNRRFKQKQEQSFGRPPEESAERLARLSLPAGSSILDVGCGQGYFLRAAEKAGHRGVGIDIALEGAKIAAKISPDSKIAVADGQRLPFAKQKFDVVTCWGTLEHHPDMQQALGEIARVIQPGGTAVFRVPNRNFWVYILLEKLGRRAGTEQAELVEHLLSLEEWRSLFQQFHFRVIHVRADDWFLRQRFHFSGGMISNFKLALRKLVLLAAPLRWTYVFDFVCLYEKHD